MALGPEHMGDAKVSKYYGWLTKSIFSPILGLQSQGMKGSLVSELFSFLVREKCFSGHVRVGVLSVNLKKTTNFHTTVWPGKKQSKKKS